jgi:hypothetical protein
LRAFFSDIAISASIWCRSLALFLIRTPVTAQRGRLQGLEEKMDHLVGAINELDKRLTKVEIKLGIQP